MDALVCVWLNVRFILFENKALIYANYSDTRTLTMPNYLALLMAISLWSENIRYFLSTHRDLLISFAILGTNFFRFTLISDRWFFEKYDIFEASLTLFISLSFSLSRFGKKIIHTQSTTIKFVGNYTVIKILYSKLNGENAKQKKNRSAHQHSHKQDNKSPFSFVSKFVSFSLDSYA